MFTGTKFSEIFMGRQLHLNVKFFWHFRDWLGKIVEFLYVFSKHFILIVLVLSFCVSEEWLCVCWYILCKILSLKSPNLPSLCYVSHFISFHIFCPCPIFLFLARLIVSSLHPFNLLNFSTPQVCVFELVFLFYSFLFHFISSDVPVVAAQIRWLILARFKLLCGRICHFFISSLFLLP